MCGFNVLPIWPPRLIGNTLNKNGGLKDFTVRKEHSIMVVALVIPWQPVLGYIRH